MTFLEQALWLIAGWVAGSITTGIVLGIWLSKRAGSASETSTPGTSSDVSLDSGRLDSREARELDASPRRDYQALHDLRVEVNEVLDMLSDLREQANRQRVR